ncbi:MAG TPA: TIGR03435 family protein [Bryobacteraceae bacterium]
MKRVHLCFLSGVINVTTLAISATSSTPILAQAPAPERLPSFEVASIKQNTSGDARTSMGARPGGRMVVTNQPLRDLIAAAFAMFDSRLLVHSRILGGPDWIDSERYDIEAKASVEFQFAPGGPPRDMLLMLRALLEERFKLVTHRETHEMPIYELVVATADGRLGPGLHKSDVDCEALFAARRAGVAPPPRQPLEPPPCGLMGGPARTIAGAVTMQQLATNLSTPVERLVIDKTGLTGRFDFNLAWTPERLPTTAPPPGIPPIDPNWSRALHRVTGAAWPQARAS